MAITKLNHISIHRNYRYHPGYALIRVDMHPYPEVTRSDAVWALTSPQSWVRPPWNDAVMQHAEHDVSTIEQLVFTTMNAATITDDLIRSGVDDALRRAPVSENFVYDDAEAVRRALEQLPAMYAGMHYNQCLEVNLTQGPGAASHRTQHMVITVRQPRRPPSSQT